MFAPGQAIESSLKHLAERRTDIFGVGEEAAQEAAIGQKMGEETRTAPVDSWDGHSSTAEAATRAARANISLNDQIEQVRLKKCQIVFVAENARHLMPCWLMKTQHDFRGMCADVGALPNAHT